MDRQRIGRRGEAIALRYLRRKGYVLVAKNIHTRFGELDLVMVDGGVLVGVEVKTRRTLSFGSPIMGVGPHKAKRLAETLERYIQVIEWKGPYRLDVVGLFGMDRSFRVEHLRGIGE